jgi:hypothetical protein
MLTMNNSYQIIQRKYLAALPDEVKQMITEAFTLIAART